MMIRSPHDLLDKARRDLEALKRASATPLTEQEAPRVLDHAMNAAMAIWHMTDWLTNSTDPRIKNALAKAALATQTAIALEATTRTSLKLCWLVTTGSRHFELVAEKAGAAFPGLEGLQRYSAVIEADGTRYSVMELLEGAIRFWVHFLDRHGIPPTL